MPEALSTLSDLICINADIKKNERRYNLRQPLRLGYIL
jgi:hypothetical protein